MSTGARLALFDVRTHRTLALRPRLERSVRREGACVIWIGPKDRDGYGRISLRGVKVSVHRLSWWLAYGRIVDGMAVLHRCDQPACVRVDHLRLGTQAENLADRDRKGRGKIPVRRGGAWTGEVRSSA